MFAYCGNNPISRCDPNGYCPNTLHGKLSSNVENTLMCTCGCGGGGIIGMYVTVGLITSIADAVNELAEKVRAWVEAQTTRERNQGNCVYVLKDPNDNYLVKYVGRTNDPARREYEHRHDPAHYWRKDYQMTVLIDNLTLEQAMLREQCIISAYTIVYLENARREIAVKNIGSFQSYIDSVAEITFGASIDVIYDLLRRR